MQSPVLLWFDDSGFVGITCRHCSLSLIVPKTITTWGGLRKHFHRKLNPVTRIVLTAHGEGIETVNGEDISNCDLTLYRFQCLCGGPVNFISTSKSNAVVVCKNCLLRVVFPRTFLVTSLSQALYDHFKEFNEPSQRL